MLDICVHMYSTFTELSYLHVPFSVVFSIIVGVIAILPYHCATCKINVENVSFIIVLIIYRETTIGWLLNVCHS